MTPGNNRQGKTTRHILLFGLGLLWLFWVIDILVHSLLFKTATISQQLLAPTLHQTLVRCLVLLLLLAFILYTHSILKQCRKMQSALEQQTQLLQKLIDTIPSPIYYMDTKGIFIGCNAAFESCIGHAKNQVIGRTFSDLVPHELATTHTARDRELFAAPGIQIFESIIQCANGSPHDVIFNKATYADSSGTVAGLVGIVIDITERKRAEGEIRALNADLSLRAAELAATNKELESFSYSASHDLSKPLTRIYGASQALEEYNHLLDENGRYFVRTIIDASRQMEDLIDALLMLSRVTQREMNQSNVNLSQLAVVTIAELRQCDPERMVDVSIAPDLNVCGDKQLLGIALGNLLGNAWKYTIKSSKPVIELGCREVEEELVYFVRDNGIGFEPKHADRMFKPFQRLHGSDEFPGTGIGLATVQRVIERHRGKVWSEGEPGKGATIYFTLSS